MATTLQHCAAAAPTPTAASAASASSAATANNPQLKRIVYSKYRELLGSYNDKANAIIETLPAYMVREDRGFHCEPTATPTCAGAAPGVGKPMPTTPASASASAAAAAAATAHANAASAACFLQQVAAAAAAVAAAQQGEQASSEMYGGSAGQRGYEAPACVQNAMMTKDKKPFTYTPGGIDLSQIKSERMAKRLARNAQAEGATGASQHNRPTQPQSPGGANSNGGAAAAMGAAAMGMPFQVLPPPPPPSTAMAAGKKPNGTPAPPPPPPSSSSTLAPPTKNGGPGSAPGSPNAPRKSPTPQRFEPPPMGFRPEIKIPPNPMAALRKVPPPVEKNTFWKDEYVRDRSKSPMVGENDRASSPGDGAQNVDMNANSNSNNNDNVDGHKKSMPAAATTTTNTQQPETNYNSNYNQQYTPPQPSYSPPAAYQQQQQQYSTPPPTTVPTTPAQQQPASPRPEFRSVPMPQSPAVNVYTRQSTETPPQRATESPFRYGQQSQPQQQLPVQQQQRAAPAISPLAHQPPAQQPQVQTTFTPPTPQPTPSAQCQSPAQTVPWRTQRSQQPLAPQQQQQQQQQQQPQSHSQPIYNNVQQQQRSRDVFSPASDISNGSQPYSTQQQPYQGPKPTNVGSLYIAPLAPPTEPTAQHIVRQQMQQQQQRDSPMRQMAPPQQQQQQPQGQQMRANVPWLSSKPAQKEQPDWARPEENGNVVPSSLNRIKSPPPPTQSQQYQASQQQQQQQPTYYQQPPPQQQQPSTFGYQSPQGNGYASPPMQNFGSHGNASSGLRLQINTNSAPSHNGPKERIIPIQLEQTPTYTPSQPNFGIAGANVGPAAYVIRSPNQFVDQGYNNFPNSGQRVMSPTQQLNAPRIVQQQQQFSNNNNNVANVGGARTRIVPIAMDNAEGTRGPISQSPIVLQNDPRSSPIQSKSFRILQKITDTIDDGSGDGSTTAATPSAGGRQDNYADAEPQLQRPTYARQMSAQQARPQTNMEQQMRRMQIGQDQQQQQQAQSPQAWNQGKNKYTGQYTPCYNFNDMPQPYVHPSEQQVPEPKKYTGSAIPSRSFKILQAMTTPENAAEMEDSDCIELNENHSNINNNNNLINHSDNENYVASSNDNNDECSVITNTSTPHPPSTTSSSSSMSSLDSEPITHATPTHPPYPAYAYPYPYHWYPPPNVNANNGEPMPTWHYPYAMPPPPPPAPQQAEHAPGANYPAYANPHQHPYPYYYPYYPPPPPPMPPTYPSHALRSQTPTIEYDSQNAYADPNALPYPGYMPPYPYPYPVAPSYSQSTTSSRASSILPDIIVTPSTDDTPSQVILQHHIKVDKRESKKRDNSVEIEEVATTGAALQHAMKRQEREGSVLDMLSQRLHDMTKVVENNLNLSKDVEKNYLGERDKEFDEKSPTDNASPVLKNAVELASDSDDSTDSESSSEDDSDATPKCVENNTGLQAIKSVTNIQVYRGHKSNTFEADDEDDVTTADGESDIFDEDDNEDDAEELELDACIEEHDDMDYIEEENLSVIYEEESELERSSDQPKTVIRRDGSSASDATTVEKCDDIEQQIEANDKDDVNANDNDNDEEGEDSVTVRLPLKFSFSRSSNDENIATVEVGKSQIEERRHSLSLESKHNAFIVAKLDNDSDEEDMEAHEYDDDCEVSVTISLTGSSRSGSVDRKSDTRRNSAAYPIEDLPTPDIRRDSISSSSEDVSVSFSLNMRNKFMGQTIQGDVTNNIAEIEQDNVKQNIKKNIVDPVTQSTEDFFATLRATKLQAQKIKEQSASYWGKAAEKKPEDCKPAEAQTQKEDDCQVIEEVEDIWANRDDDDTMLKRKPILKTKTLLDTANDSFWSTVADVTKEKVNEMNVVEEAVEEKAELETVEETEHSEDEEQEDDEVDFWAEIEKSNSEKSTTPQKKAISTTAVREYIRETRFSPITLQARVESMPKVQQAESYIQCAEEKQLEVDTDSDEEETDEEEADEVKLNAPQAVSIEEEEEDDFWASVETAKTSLKSRSNITTPDSTLNEPAQATDNKTHIWTEPVENTSLPMMETDNEIEFWPDNDDHEMQLHTQKPAFDASLYPEEPREVDTDEEIDFWAEIEAKNQGADGVNFYKAASFWASKERQNSVEETPYTPVTPKAFAANLPDEPTVDVGIWAALEAAKGEEPIIIDPALEEEKLLAAQFNDIPMEIDEEEQDDANENKFETASTHEPNIANVWEPIPEASETHESTDFWTNERESNIVQKPLEFWANPDTAFETTAGNDGIKAEQLMETDEADVKRCNYRKAMAFFTTSIDDHKEASVERNVRSGRSSNRNSMIEDDTTRMNTFAIEQTEDKRYNTPDATQPIANANLVAKPPSGHQMIFNEMDTSDKEMSSPTQDFKSKVSTVKSVTPTNLEQDLLEDVMAPEIYVEPVLQRKSLLNGLPDLGLKKDEPKISVRDRIFAFETSSIDLPEKNLGKLDIKTHSLSVESCTPKGSLSRNNSSQRSESEMEEDDSGVTDMNKPLSETDTESESFPELRKMTSYQRAATHSRLFKLLQDENDPLDDDKALSREEMQKLADEFQFKPSRRKIVHNVSITRRQNPKVLNDAETMTQRRERLSLPLRKNTSIDADNPSTPNSPASPILGQPSNGGNVSDKLVNELVQSLLLKGDSTHLRRMPMEKLQAAAKRVLEEELDSLENTSVETTPAPTPNDGKSDKSYADYYDTWSKANAGGAAGAEVVPSKALRALQDGARRSPWTARCPRVLSSKTVNRDLARVTESPEIFMRSSKSPDCLTQSRESSVSRWKKV